MTGRNPVLVTATLTGKEAELLISRLSHASPTQVQKTRFDIDKKAISLHGFYEVDLSGAEPKYVQGELMYGPVVALLFVESLDIVLDWHNVLGIPRRCCIGVPQDCGLPLRFCWDWDLGISRFRLISNLPIPESLTLAILYPEFRDKGDAKGFELYGQVDFVSALIDIFTTGVPLAAVRLVEGLIKNFLERILGSGWIAELFIDAIMWALRAVDVALTFIQRELNLLTEPIQLILHAIFGDKLDIKLAKDPVFPREIQLIKAEKKHNAVMLKITTPPKIDFAKNITLTVLA